MFELVKNAYDADASGCDITLDRLDDPANAQITVQDDGVGMDYETVVGVWLEPGTDHRGQQRAADRRSAKHKRLPLGEKGVGRFAVHKLGRRIELVTRSKGDDEIVVSIDWHAFESAKYLADVGVDISVRDPEIFLGKKHGTRIVVTGLREVWARRQVRELHRSVTSICSPFDGPDHFSARLHLDPDADWLHGLLDPATVLKQALYSAHGSIDSNTVSGTYKFTPLAAMEGKLEKRVVEIPELQLMSASQRAQRLGLADQSIGPIEFDFRIFDLEPAVLALTSTDKSGLRDYLNVNGGVRVYRDGVRVFDLGEPGNDWLDLEGRRVNRPSVKIGNNQIIGAVHLQGDKSRGLVEKTNREGFIENESYRTFREAIQFALNQVEAERVKDKARVRQLFSRRTVQEPVIDELTKLREQVEARGLTAELGNYLDRIEKQFSDVRARLLTAAGPGLTLTVVIHEVEKIIKELSEAIRRGAQKERVSVLVKHLSDVVDGLSFLVRKSGNSRERASALIDQALFNTEYRLKAHTGERQDNFAPDPKVPAADRAELKDYEGSGYDRGHQAPAADFKSSQKLTDESFYLSNMAPQVGAGFNRAVWAHLEDFVREKIKENGSGYVITGPLYYDPAEDDPKTADGIVKMKWIGRGRVAVPTHFFKIMVLPKPGGKASCVGFVLENKKHPTGAPHNFSQYIKSVDWIEERAGINFMPDLNPQKERELEAKPGLL